jgi:hypothetical protein
MNLRVWKRPDGCLRANACDIRGLVDHGRDGVCRRYNRSLIEGSCLMKLMKPHRTKEVHTLEDSPTLVTGWAEMVVSSFSEVVVTGT